MVGMPKGCLALLLRSVRPAPELFDAAGLFMIRTCCMLASSASMCASARGSKQKFMIAGESNWAKSSCLVAGGLGDALIMRFHRIVSHQQVGKAACSPCKRCVALAVCTATPYLPRMAPRSHRPSS